MIDNYGLWRSNEQRLEEELARCPVCCCCMEPIQDEKLFRINSNLYCMDCAEDEFMERTEHYMKK